MLQPLGASRLLTYANARNLRQIMPRRAIYQIVRTTERTPSARQEASESVGSRPGARTRARILEGRVRKTKSHRGIAHARRCTHCPCRPHTTPFSPALDRLERAISRTCSASRSDPRTRAFWARHQAWKDPGAPRCAQDLPAQGRTWRAGTPAGTIPPQISLRAHTLGQKTAIPVGPVHAASSSRSISA